MDLHTAFDIAITIAGFLMGFVLKSIWDSINELRSKLHSVETLVVGEYVKWDGLRESMRPVIEQLTRIEDKLDKKVDK